MNSEEAARAGNYYRTRMEELAGDNLRYDNLVSELKHEIMKQRKGFALLTKLQTTFGVQLHLSSIFEITLQSINESFNMDKSVILIRRSGTKVYYPSQLQGFSNEESQRLGDSEFDIPVEYTNGQKEILVNQSTKSEFFFDEISSILDLPFFIGIPIPIENKVETILICGRLKEVKPFYPAFTHDDIYILQAVAELITATMHSRHLILLQKELSEAKAIQSALFPAKSIELSNFRIDGMCETCLEVGGDWYDYIQLPSGKIGVVLADVTGKGLSAALLVSSARTIFRVISSIEESPSEVLNKVNEYLVEELPVTRFITMIYVVIDPVTGIITMVNAGHMWPFCKSRDSVKQLEYDGGMPLGIQKGKYSEYEINIGKGDKLILYSDGVSEAANGQEQFFDEKMIGTSLRKESAGLHTIYKDLKTFVGSAEQSDDITLVEIEKI